MLMSQADVVACKIELNMPAHEVAKLRWSCDVNRALLWDYEVAGPIAAGIVLGD
jgi:hypothetical protein